MSGKLSRLTPRDSVTADNKTPSNKFITFWNTLCDRIEGVSASRVTATADVPITGYVTLTIDGATYKVPTIT